MTEISIKKNNIISNGHSGIIDDDGIARACCAVSTLMYTLDTALEDRKICRSTFIGDGYMEVQARPQSEDEQISVDVIYGTIASGLSSLAMQYPDNIKLRKEG